MKAFSTQFIVELKLSLRDMNMPLFAIIMPAVIMALYGMLFGGDPAYDGASYSFIDQSVPAISTVGICAGGAMGLPLTVAGYRQRGVLKRFFVTPISAGMILGVQVAIFTLYSLISTLLVFGIATIFFDYHFVGSIIGFAGAYLLVLVAMFSIGMLLGGLAPNEKTASMGASLLYFPMLLLSGTTLPYEIMPTFLQRIADVLPLTQGIKLLKATSLGLPIESAIIPVVIMVAWAIICTALAWRFFKWE